MSLSLQSSPLSSHARAGRQARQPMCPIVARGARTGRSTSCAATLPDRPLGSSTVDIRQLSDIITAQAMEGGDQQHALEEIAKVLGEPLAAIKNMAFRQKTLLSLDAAEVKARVEQVAKIVDVPYETARQMCVIQPSLLTETQKQAEALQYGLRIICHDLKAEKAEIIDLIIKNPSLLHGRQMRLSVADMAHLALLREPKGRIVD
ncbi:hypothetical protein TSOC_004259 [Tetrabaena socialis]|uniref:Uncharacterized protein n=1 Tax=Tetrabaena socialis TaxID=47790 RepID=A0A2J8A9D5_9CHLO|nr:hypothetical protein TSOC_004259 [Tetrabaena socialis]|eukprot:PNH09142.1 hypothetical protein TSOC_004259 [Tetrabaena socialis]